MVREPPPPRDCSHLNVHCLACFALFCPSCDEALACPWCVGKGRRARPNEVSRDFLRRRDGAPLTALWVDAQLFEVVCRFLGRGDGTPGAMTPSAAASHHAAGAFPLLKRAPHTQTLFTKLEVHTRLVSISSTRAQGRTPAKDAANLKRFSVVLDYSEPTFDARLGRPTVVRQWTWEGDAADEANARHRAMAEFKWLANASSVGWVREVHDVRVKVTAAPG